jgi:ubiquinone/menaquinone biosynthesis C-methylase UbiE
MNNKEIYNTKEIAGDYCKHDYLIKPEKVILEQIKKVTNRYNMLDIGVGAGRTTKYFAPLFDNYCGVDFAEMMIDTCAKRFADMDYQFRVADARSLAEFSDNSIDFALFSFNGIDCVPVNDRLLVLNEIFRVLKLNGLFAFSIHNSYNIPDLFSFQIPKNPLHWINEFKRKRGVNKMNPAQEQLITRDFAEVIDGDLDFKASYIYAKPEAQIKQLESVGFTVKQVLSMKGEPIAIQSVSWEKVRDSWLYFLCQK